VSHSPFSTDRAKTGLTSLNSILGSDREMLDELAFQRVVARERRRTERSRKPFMLMLVDGYEQSLLKGFDYGQLLEALAVSIRETDVVGWYKAGHVFGVIFTEINIDDRGAIIDSMTSRMDDVLHIHLGLEQLKGLQISFHVFPEDWHQGANGNPSNPTLYPDLSRRTTDKRIDTVLKRVMDIVGSALTLVLLFPVFAVIALAIKLTSKGPVFFRQQRIGEHGKPFVFLKFRSMYAGNDPHVHREYVKKLIAGNAERHACNGDRDGVFKLTRDSRITPLGAFLRRASLDELPQFINVLRGEMSLVGPRPPIPYEVEAYDLWHRRRLVEAKPGITGLWQVGGRSRVKFDDMVRLDLEYARTWSIWMDIKILVRTPLAVVLGEGAH
jgi:lipopolysaccharide/colanic/teichoic acid biosynthesis glycosyltransferase